jgi:hypothetical protein
MKTSKAFTALEARVAVLEQAILRQHVVGAPAPAAPPLKPSGLSWHAIYREMHAGKKLRRAPWPVGKYVVFAEHAPHMTLVEEGKDGEVRNPAAETNQERVTRADLAATDWQVVETL